MGDIKENRNKSFWVKDIGEIIKSDLSDLQQQYNAITNELERYFSLYFDEIKEQRNLSIHYDKNPVKVYDMLLKLNIEETFKKLIPFLNILNKMFDLTHLLVIGYDKELNKERINNKTQFENLISKLDGFKNAENEKSISLLQDNMRNSMNVYF